MAEPMRILFVEDLPSDAELAEREIRSIFPESKYVRVETEDNYLAALEAFKPDIIICDYKLPSFDGMKALKIALEKAPEIPFIILTGSVNEEVAVECMKQGAWDYVIKEHVKRLGPAVVAALEQKRIRDKNRSAEARIKESEKEYRDLFEHSLEGIFKTTPDGRFLNINPANAHMHGFASPEEMMATITDIGTQLYVHPEDRDRWKRLVKEHGTVENYVSQQYRKDGSIIWVSVSVRAIKDEQGNVLYFIGNAVDITESRLVAEKLRKSLIGTIHVLSAAVEIRDPYTAGHQKKVSRLARSIAQGMGLSKDIIDSIRMAGSIHDIGKLSVPAEILSKPTKLTPLEMDLIKVHPRSGYNILKDAGLPYPIAEMVYQHHERMDGSGYPKGLKNGEILLESSILGVADVVEAIASHRPYRPALGIDVALNEIEQQKGILYYPEVVDACLKLFREKGFAFEEV